MLSHMSLLNSKGVERGHIIGQKDDEPFGVTEVRSSNQRAGIYYEHWYRRWQSHISDMPSQIKYNTYMAIQPKCDKCGLELTEFGGILLSPPDEDSTVKKFHLCKSCYKKIAKNLKA
jgi:hypothetical protein